VNSVVVFFTYRLFYKGILEGHVNPSQRPRKMKNRTENEHLNKLCRRKGNQGLVIYDFLMIIDGFQKTNLEGSSRHIQSRDYVLGSFLIPYRKP
jgi:hypothetical protein